MISILRRVFLSLSVALLITSFASGCGAKKRAVAAATHEVVAQRDDGESDVDDQPHRVNETTEMSTDQMGSFCSGVLSCTIEGIGWVLALPLRGIVGLFDALF